MAMMMPMIGGPPEHAFLRGHGGEKGHHELKRAAGLERSMRKIAVIPRGHKEHADVIGGEANNQVRPVELQEECGNAGQVNDEERKRADKGDAVAAPQSNPAECHVLPLSNSVRMGVLSERRTHTVSGALNCQNSV